ncbi:MAG: AMP-binding protein, partial [Pseudomonadota bacterium]|nr:AMP-binding protein [Pseudomonadota bacterium]
LIRKHKVTMAGLVPSAVNLWLQAAPDHRNALESLKLLQVGGAHFPESHARLVPQILGCKLQQVFGMAEGLVNYTRLDDPDELVFTTQGRPISPDDEIKIVGEDGQPVPDGETGRLATRGPYTFRGYFRSPEHNADVFDEDGFYYSGDLVCRTGEGYLRVVGRVKDQINRGGEKIAAEEVESLLLLHPDVREAALVAIQDPALGEKSCAVIVSDNSCIKPLALRRHLMSHGVADYKLPDRFTFADAIPLTAFGKPDKKKLRTDLAQKFTPALTQ